MGSSMSTRMKHRKSQRREDTQSSEPQQKSNTIDSSRASSTNGSASTKTRNYHNVPNSTYWFPNDDEEMDRLISQHFAIKSLFNGNIVDKAFPLLPTPFEEGAKVLDVGCGPGTWLMDIATEYPQVDCLGVDMCDVFPKQIRPPNVRFEVANVTDGLPYPDNTFDFVNVRLLLIGLQSKQWPEMWKEVMRVLKPGGLAQSIEAGMLLEGTPLVNKAGQAFIDMMKARDQEPFVSRKMDKLMEATGYKIIHFEIKDICLSQKDALTQEFASDIVHIFRGVQHVIGKALDIKDEEYPQFLEDLRKGMSEKPDAMWSYSVCLGQKPQ